MAEASEKSDIAKREEEVLAFWNERKIFEKTLKKDAPSGVFTFNDGPPFATGLPHYGHLLQSALKDAIPRYKTMQGFRVERTWGWDCHGLPIENIVEKELGVKSKKEIVEMGVKKFNDLCREKIFTYVDYWNSFIPRFGRWADMEHPYRTMDTAYMESEWWAFKELYDKGLVYEDYRSMHICPRCETTLAQAEVSEGYLTVKDWAVTVKFPLVDEPNTYLLAWTTTAWTLPGNVAIAVGADIAYATIESGEKKFILAKELVEKVFEGKEYSIVSELRGRDLVGKRYTPPFDSYINDASLPNRENAWRVYAADFVTTETGTGIAHEAPAFGADDMALAQEVGLPLIQHVGMNGVIKPEVEELSGLHVKPIDDRTATDVEVIKYLAKKGLLFAKEKYEHSYPHCWRCDTPLLNYATGSWFISVEKIKNTLLKTAEDISWVPPHVKGGRWGEWLRGARDWSISRQRFWANTIPVWRCDACKEERVFGSLAELNEASGLAVADLHKDVVDEVVVPCPCGSGMHRVPDVLDTWFDSGSMPFASFHYPFENKEKVEERTPVDFIAEAQDQVSKWFYYQHVLSGALFGKPSFRNVVTSGLVLAGDGKKMAKRLQNYPDPKGLVDSLGADALRLYILSSPAVRGEDLNFLEHGVAQIANKVIGRLANSYALYALYQDDVAHEDASESTHILDRWIVAELWRVHAEVTKALDAYELDRATRAVTDFVENFSTWYVRRSRDRYKDTDEAGKKAALQTTRWVLRKYAKIIAPFAPFIADWLWVRVRREDDPESVHLASWCESRAFDGALLHDMNTVRDIVSRALEARARANIKVRQPLAQLTIQESRFKNHEELLELIQDEVNVKAVALDPSLPEGEVKLDTTITPELKEEGEVREMVRTIQDLRKQAALSPKQKAVLVFAGDTALLEKHWEAVRVAANLERFEKGETTRVVHAEKS